MLYQKTPEELLDFWSKNHIYLPHAFRYIWKLNSASVLCEGFKWFLKITWSFHVQFYLNPRSWWEKALKSRKQKGLGKHRPQFISDHVPLYYLAARVYWGFTELVSSLSHNHWNPLPVFSILISFRSFFNFFLSLTHFYPFNVYIPKELNNVCMYHI